MADPARPHDSEFDGEEHDRLLTLAKGYLPFLNVIINSENLGIQSEHKDKLRSLYEMVNGRRLSTSKLESCKGVFSSLYSKYFSVLSEEQLETLNVQPTSEGSNVSISLDVETNINDGEKIITRVETPSQITSVSDNDMPSEKQNGQENDCALTTNKLDNESSLQKEKMEILKYAINASVDILNKSDKVSSGSEYAQEIFDGLKEEKKTYLKKIVNGVNFDDIDVNLMAKAIERCGQDNNDAIEPPPLPPPEILELGLSKDLVESNVMPIETIVNGMMSNTPHTSSFEPAIHSNIREKLQNDVSKIHKIGLSSEPKKKVISSLKPGTLIDLENSKTVSSSLHIESLRPAIKSTETSNFKPVPLTNVNRTERLLHASEFNDRDPRKKKNLSLNPENSTSHIKLSSQTHPLIPAPIHMVQNRFSESIPTISSVDRIIPPFPSTMFESNRQEIIAPNNFSQFDVSPNSYHAGQAYNNFFNNPSTQIHGYKHNETHNAVHPYYSSNSAYPNSAHHSANESKYLKSGSNNCPNENFTRRDPRLARSDQKPHEPKFRSFKEYREAKYGREKCSSREPISRGRSSEKVNTRPTDRTKTADIKNSNSYSTLGTVSDMASSIKGFKIPKVKHKEDNDKQKYSNTEKIADNSDKYRKSSDTLRVGSNSDKNKSESASCVADKRKNDTSIKDTSGTGSNKKTEVNKDSYSDKCTKAEVSKENRVNKESKAVSSYGKTEKCPKTSVTKSKNLESKKNEATNDTEKDLKNERTKDRTKSDLITTEKSSKYVTNDSSSASEINSVETKSKKPKKYSKEKEFEKIVKEAETISKDDNLIGPRTRTRNVLKNKDETTNIDKNNYSKHNNKRNSAFEEGCYKPFDFFDKSDKNCNDDNSELLDETGHNVISSTSKDLPEIDSLTDVVFDKSQEENMVSSNEINSTADVQSIENHDILVRKEKFMAYLRKLDVDKLSELLETPQIANLFEDKVDDGSVLKDDAEEQNKSTKKKKENKRNESISDDEIIDVVEEYKNDTKKSNLNNDLNFNSSSDDLSTDRVVESKSNDCEKYQPNENLAIKDNTSKVPLNKVVIVLHKFSTNSNDMTCDIISPNHEPSVDSNSGFETASKVVPKKKRKRGSKANKNKINSKVVSFEEEPQILSKPLELSPVESATREETQSHCEGAEMEQNLTATAVTETNVGVTSKTIKKPRSKKSTELDKLHAYTSEMYDCDAILNIPNVRHCRTNKLVDYANIGVGYAKRSTTSKVDQLDSCSNRSSYEFDDDFENPKSKSTKKQSKVLKKNTVSTSKSNDNDLPSASKTQSKPKAKKQFTKRKSQLDLVTINKEIEEIANEEIEVVDVLPKMLTENDFKDKLYCQSADIWLECKFCLYCQKGLNIVRHYVEQHCGEEVLPSRLPKNCAESLIHESLKENFGYFNSEDLKSTTRAPVNKIFTCVFCRLVFNDIIQFYNHITCHTGEYRYKCKMCEKVYSSADELEKHVLEHTNYDRTDGISHLLHSSPTLKVFGYLCPFCYYLQLDYYKIVRHMEMRHNDEDKRFNGRWTVVRVSMSTFVDENIENVVIDYANIVGCLPPVPNQPARQFFSNTHDTESKIPIAQLVVEARKHLIGNVERILFDQPPQEIQQVTPNLSQANSTSRGKECELSIVNFGLGYTMKENCQMVTVADLSCVLVDQMLMFKCRTMSCSERPFTTVDMKEFVKHIEQIHGHVIWDRKCTQCGSKVEMVSEESIVIKNALEHMVSHHLVLKVYDEFNPDPVKNLIEKQNASTSRQYNVENVPTVTESPSKPLIRCVPINDMVDDGPFIKGTEENAFFTYSDFSTNGSEDSEINRDCSLPVSEILSLPDSDVNRDSPIVVTNDSFLVNELLNVSNSNEMNIDTTERFVQETMDENTETSHHIVVSNNALEELSGNATISSHSFNLGFQISNVMSLNEGRNALKNKDSKNALASCYSQPQIVITPENAKRDFQKNYCGPGHFLVNEGKPLDGCAYALVDTTYKKWYAKQAKDYPLSAVKTRLACKEMLAVPRLLNLFKCMDRTCIKMFSENEKGSFISHIKSHFSYAEKKNKSQITDTEHFRKCAYCYKMFDDEDLLAEHIAHQYTYCKYFCPYCFYRAYTPTHVMIHINQFHSKCKHKVVHLEHDEKCEKGEKEKAYAVDYFKVILPYVCNVGSCKYSCFLSENFIHHLLEEHQQCDKYSCYICEKEKKTFFALQPSKMVDHLKMHNINNYQCMFCLFGTGSPLPMLIHLSTEHFEYNPICLNRIHWENPNEDDIANLKIIKLTLSIASGIIETINLPLGKCYLSESLPQITIKRHVQHSDVISAAMKSALIFDSVEAPPNAVVINVPDREQFTDSTNYTRDISNEVIMIDDVSEGKNDIAKVAVSSGYGNNTKQHQSTDDNAVIVIDDDEDDLSYTSTSNNVENTEPPVKRKRSTQKSGHGPNKQKKLAWPVVPLDNLFYCKGCDINLQDGQGYLLHLNVCQSLQSNERQCPFCIKSFKTDFHITEHIKLHGPERFSCSFCDFKAPSKRAIEHHMRVGHRVKTFDFVPVEADSCDTEKDEFVVYEDLTNSKKHCTKKFLFSCSLCNFIGRSKNIIAVHMKNIHCIDQFEMHVMNDASPANDFTQQWLVVKSASDVNVAATPPETYGSVKRKHSGDHFNTAAKKKTIDKASVSEKTDERVTPQQSMLFSPETADSIPMLHVFSQSVGCSLCSYNTKVRSNLILHLKGHEIGQDNTTKEIVNPVPSMGKSDLMFDKMINLSASSMEAVNMERLKNFEINKKIIEVPLENQLNLKSYPQLVDKNERFICSVCHGNFLYGDKLKKHISMFHPQFSHYSCPHYPCAKNKQVYGLNKIECHLMYHGENLYGCQYCDFIDFNRTEMRTHMRTNHLPQVTSAHQSYMNVIRQSKSEDDSLEKNIRQDQCIEAEWICNLCSSGTKYTKTDIKSHIFVAHKVTKMFKCPMCQFEHDDNNGKVFEDHYKVEHPSVAVKCLPVYEKVTCAQEQQNQLPCPLNVQNLFEQQALESIEPSIVRPACRGIPVESAGKSVYNKSRGAMKSPKVAKKTSPISKPKVVTLTGNFSSVHDSFGELSAGGQLFCPKCNAFETTDITRFHHHLCKEVVTKTYKCLNCCEEFSSIDQITLHVKKHGDESQYERVENEEKLNWVNAVVRHQCALKVKFDEANLKRIDQGRTGHKNVLNLSLKKTRCEDKEKASGSTEKITTTYRQIPTNNEIISLLDDSDDE